LVDDGLDDVELYRSALEAEGYAVWGTTDGEEGIWLARTGQPDIIVTDLHMPGSLTGFRLLQLLATNDRTSGIPRLVVTADGTDTARRMAFAFRPAEFHVKPFLPELLVSAVRRVLSLELPAAS
jgi:CheY-like chemotaxis protein